MLLDLDSAIGLIASTQGLRDLPISKVIQKRATDDRNHNVKCWSELRHVTGRLESYLRAVEALISAHETWEELFLKFEVDFISSSARYPWPVKTDPEPAYAIIGRMAPEDEVEVHRSRAEQLQLCNLDGIIADKWQGEGPPYVHAEVLLLDWLENTGGARPCRFFNHWQYIGSSKPTCRLCQYYFEATGTAIRVRPSHRNIYLAWRLPDIYDHQGGQGVQKWRSAMSYIKKRICQDALLLLEERNPDRRDHDSNTTSTRIQYATNMVSVGIEDKIEHKIQVRHHNK